MSTIPPNWMGSIIGTHDTQRQAGAARRKEEAEQIERTEPARFSEKLQEVITEADQDSEVFEDAEGLGSQGRSTSEEDHEEAAEQAADQSGDSGGHLDLQA